MIRMNTPPFIRTRPVAPPKTRTHAKTLRNNQTKPEWILWLMLRGHQMGAKFRRQQPIGPYIADFYSASLKLVIEADGGQHTSEKDAQRNTYMRDNGLTVLRFWNDDILQNEQGVYLTILETIKNIQEKI